MPVDAYRGAGRPEATFVLERLVDVAATDMGIDRSGDPPPQHDSEGSLSLSNAGHGRI